MNPTATEARLDSLLRDLEAIRACTLQCEAMFSDAGWAALPRIWHWSPLGWQYGHVPCFEEQFVLVRLKGDAPLNPAYAELFMPATTPPPERIHLPGRDLIREYLHEVRRRSMEYIRAAGPTPDVLFTVEMLVEHESMHLEHQLHMACWLPFDDLRRTDGPMALHSPREAGAPGRMARARIPSEGAYLAGSTRPADAAHPVNPDGSVWSDASVRSATPPGATAPGDMIRVPAGMVRIGGAFPDRVWDNELPAFETWVDAFDYDALPVTNGEYLRFVEEGGYADRRWWSDAGWASIELTGALHPYYWRQDGDSWRLRTLFEEIDLPLDHPVCGVSWYEAEAYARYAGKRLLTEYEWERAAQLAGSRGGNHDFLYGGTIPVGTLGESAGGLDLAGQVWEWTSSWFKPYDGFVPGPYRRYSEPQFGEVYKVLKGGCWATIARLTRPSFRNWYNPHLRPIFAGIRLALDADGHR